MNTFRSYDASGNRTTAQEDTTVVQSTFNEINQIETLPSSGAIRFEGTLDEPGTVTLNGAPARMLTGTHFETDLVLPSGTTSHVYVAATDGNNNQSTQEYLVNVPATSGMEPEYDADGNTITNGRGHTYAWDAESRLISITYGDDSKTEFTYDALSRRVAVVEKDPMGTETSAKHLLWVGLSICEERDALHAVTKRYHANGFTDGVGAKFFYTRDHLGSVREVVDATGAITDSYRYDPYGKVERVTPPPSPSVSSDFRYTGHFYHEKSDLHLAPYRAYDATIGRWISEDPIQEAGGINLYAYVNGKLITHVDFTGLDGQSTLNGAQSFFGGVGSFFRANGNNFRHAARTVGILGKGEEQQAATENAFINAARKQYACNKYFRAKVNDAVIDIISNKVANDTSGVVGRSVPSAIITKIASAKAGGYKGGSLGVAMFFGGINGDFRGAVEDAFDCLRKMGMSESQLAGIPVTPEAIAGYVVKGFLGF